MSWLESSTLSARVSPTALCDDHFMDRVTRPGGGNKELHVRPSCARRERLSTIRITKPTVLGTKGTAAPCLKKSNLRVDVIPEITVQAIWKPRL